MITRQIEWFATCCNMLGNIDLDIVFNDFTSAKNLFVEPLKHYCQWTHRKLVFIADNKTSREYLLYYATIFILFYFIISIII
jgi:hypothetical protein